jgi:hypothetical protein
MSLVLWCVLSSLNKKFQSLLKSYYNKRIIPDDIITTIEKHPTSDKNFNANILTSLYKSQSAKN